MASTMASNERVAWGYVTNDGTIYNVAAKKAYLTGADAAKYGGAAAALGRFSIPNGFRTRKAQVYNQTNNVSRWLTVYEPDATLFVTEGTDVTLNFKGVDTVFTSTGATISERAERKQLKDTAAD